LGGDHASRSAFVSTLGGLGVQARNISAAQLGLAETALRADGAVWLDDDSIDPEQLLKALNVALLSLGVVQQSGRALRVEDGAVIDSRGRAWKAQAVVLACGSGLAKLHRPGWSFRQSEGWGATYQGELRLGCSVEGLGQTLVPLSAQRWKVGGSTLWTGDPPLRDWVQWQGEEVSRRQGVRCSAPDGLPLAGLLRPGVYALGGLGRNGLLTAPLLAKGLAQEIMDGAPPPWLAPFSPLRSDIGRQRSWSR
jgi:glycine/D-amino acid oxidase-like deaminating enzyme